MKVHQPPLRVICARLHIVTRAKGLNLQSQSSAASGDPSSLLTQLGFQDLQNGHRLLPPVRYSLPTQSRSPLPRPKNTSHSCR
jgi:hypothetical protein